MPEEPNEETARKIRDKILSYDWFIFLATPNSIASRWCPWEIGYADGKKANEKIILIRLDDGSDEYWGNEYLNLYRELSSTKKGGLRLFPRGEEGNGVLLEKLNR